MTRFELLKDLYSIHSPSGREKKMRRFIRRKCKELGASVEQDNVGNLYVIKGESDTYPCVVAHMDQVQELHSKDFRIYLDTDVIFAFSAKTMSTQGLGADDKNGIWVALCLLEDLPALKCAFFVQEEVGCVGSSAADMEFFKDVRFVLQADRKNGNDLITNISGKLCSDEFLADIPYDEYGYVPTTGLMTDVLSLCENGVGVSCINFSCGYYSPHTDHETTVWSELVNALSFARAICVRCTDVYPHKYARSWSAYYPQSGRHGKYYDWYDDEYYGTYGGFGTATKNAKEQANFKEDDIDEYFAESYDSDLTTMEMILSDEGDIGLEKIKKDYSDWFFTKDSDILFNLYDEAKSNIMF